MGCQCRVKGDGILSTVMETEKFSAELGYKKRQHHYSKIRRGLFLEHIWYLSHIFATAIGMTPLILKFVEIKQK